jgi:hypothetical protein
VFGKAPVFWSFDDLSEHTNSACIEKMRTRRTKCDPDDPNNELCKKELNLALSCAFTVEVLPPPRVTVVKKEMT